VVGHIVEGLSGVETVVPFALFWIVAAILTAPLSSAGERERSHRRVAALWAGGGVALAAIGCFAVAATSIWLMGSHMYMHGIALARSGRLVDASRELEQATALVPWLPGPRSMAGEAGFRAAELEADPARRAVIRRQAQELLATPYGGSAVSADVWRARGRVALARARDGEPGQLPAALAALSRADRLRPNDQQILTALSVALLTDGQAAQARALAERLVLRDAENTFAWMVVARASTRLGDQDRARRAEWQVRSLARPEDLPFFEALR
jgi:Flp pilus assembly protein TadD